MVTGRQIQLIKQVGEYLVTAELSRRELIAASFSGNVPGFDILAVNADNNLKTIQVKTTTKNRGWLLDAQDYLDISISDENMQMIKGKRELSNREIIFCFVNLKSFGKKSSLTERDEFYIIPVKELQNIVYNKYFDYLKKIGGSRPKNPKSTNKQITPAEIADYKEKWNYLSD